MNRLLILLLALVFLVGPGCAVIEDQAPVLSHVVSTAAELGGCVKLVCALPLSDCRLWPGRCQQ